MQFARADGIDADLYVDAVEEGAGYALLVVHYLHARARAILRRVVVVTARAWVHGRHKHEARWKIERGRRPGDGHMPILQRLPQDFQGGTRKLGEFIEEKHSPVREGDFAGFGM